MSDYFSLENVLSTVLAEPDVCDSIAVEYRGVTLHVYGFLHGVNGAGNAKYHEFIQRSIDRAPQPVLIEKRFSSVYSGVAAELEDWAPIQLWQAFTLPGRMMLHPGALASLGFLAFLEHIRKTDRFSDGHAATLANLGDSPKFHLIDPVARRAICGFPDSATYFRIGIERYISPFAQRHSAIHVPDADWTWLEAVEPSATIALRSLHMIEFATVYALQRGIPEVSVFVGETHNTDIAWLAAVLENESWLDSWSPDERKVIASTIERARLLGIAVATGHNVALGRAAFETSFYSGAVLSVSALLGLLVGATALTAKAYQRSRATMRPFPIDSISPK